MAPSCPCDSGETFDRCCGPVLAGAPAPTAERLMRSRYTAYVRGDGAHLLRTWHPTTRPARVEIDPGLVLTGLEVLRTEAGGVDDLRGVVEFRAAHADLVRGTEGPTVGVLHEVSRFVRSDDGWQYVRGRHVEEPTQTVTGHALDETSP